MAAFQVSHQGLLWGVNWSSSNLQASDQSFVSSSFKKRKAPEFTFKTLPLTFWIPYQSPKSPCQRPSGLLARPSSGKTLPLPHRVSKQPGCEMAEICREPSLALLPSPPLPFVLCSPHRAFPFWATRGRPGASFLCIPQLL